MISKLYIDNYKCFVNFEYTPGPYQLLLGANGTGKTTILDVLETLRDFIDAGAGITTQKAFPCSTLTAWDQRKEQTFELAIKGNGAEYVYSLTIEQNRADRKNRILSERVRFDGKRLYEFDGSEAHLFRDDGSAGPVFPFDWTRSAIATIPERPDNTRLSWFRRRMKRIRVFSPDPNAMISQTDDERPEPDRRLIQLASWIRNLRLVSPDASRRLAESLRREVLEGFTEYKFDKVGERAFVLKFDFHFADSETDPRSTSFSLPLEDLSTGQRNLLGLFAILHAAVDADSTLCIDEPDNFVALREIQPWLVELLDKVRETSAQCLLISHHPELIDYLAADHGMRFFRENAGPVRVQPFESTADHAMRASELVARGWENG
jgi:predicted ATPase